MKNILKSVVFVGSLCIGSMAGATPDLRTYDLTLSSPSGSLNQICVVACSGTFEVNLDTLGDFGNPAQVEITAINIVLTTDDSAIPTLPFGNLMFINLATWDGTEVTLVDVSFSTTLTLPAHVLNILNGTWGVFGLSPDGLTGGGTGVGVGTPIHTPEPSTWLLMGSGLVGLAFYSWRKRKQEAVTSSTT